MTRTSVSRDRHEATLYSTLRMPRGGSTHSIRRLLLNPKFFRNGIVMLVLVVGHRGAAVHVDPVDDPDQAVNYSEFLADVKAGEVAEVKQQGETLTVKGTGPTQTYTVIVPNILTRRLFGHADRGERGRPAVDRDVQRRPDARHVLAGAAADRAPAPPRHRRLHLLHDATGPGHQ